MKLWKGEIRSQFLLGQLPDFPERCLGDHVTCDRAWSALEPRDVLSDQVAFVPRVFVKEFCSFGSLHSEIVDSSIEH